MMYFARNGLSILLMLLQLAAPLIHAHKNSSDFDGVFHLPEFEQIDLSAKNHSAILVPATQNDQVVTVSAGMKNKKRFLFDDVIDFFLVLSFFIPIVASICFTSFFIGAEPIKRSAFNLALPRAPPFFLVNFCQKI